MTMLYHYVFEWRLVRDACPEYDKYLKPDLDYHDEDEYEADLKLAEDAARDVTEDAPEAEDYDPFNPLVFPVADVAEDDTAVGAYAQPLVNGRPFLPADVVDGGDAAGVNHRTKDLSEEEMSVLNEMHDGTVKETIDVNGMEVMETSEPPIRRRKAYFLKEEYCYYPPMPPPMDVLMLPPPKKFLAPNSCFFTRPDINYKITNGHSRDDDVVHAVYTRLMRKENKIVLITTAYRFDRRKDLMREITKETSFTTYNTDTYKLYLTHKISMPGNERSSLSNRYRKEVRQASLYAQAIARCIPMGETILRNKFTRAILNHAKSVMPDIYLPDVIVSTQNTFGMEGAANMPIGKLYLQHSHPALSAAMMQLRVGQPLPWLRSGALVDRMLSLLEGDHQYILVGPSEDPEEHERMVRRHKKKYAYKLVANLKLNPKLKTVLKSVLGSAYRELYYRILLIALPTSNLTSYIPHIAYAANAGHMPKSAYHFISHLIKNFYELRDQHAFNAESCLAQIATQMAPDFRDEDEFECITEHHATAYVKFLRGIIDNHGSQITGWTTWRDMFVMAHDMGIRIRPNKLKTAKQVQKIHDKLSEYHVRDSNHREEYGKFEFLKFDSPDKEYNGFKFIQLMDTEELIAEGTAMHHCVGGYSTQCLNGGSIIFSMAKDDRSWITIELRGSDPKYAIAQKYTIKDFTVKNPEILKAIKDWHGDIIKMHKKDGAIYKTLAKKFYKEQKAPILAAKREEARKRFQEDGKAKEIEAAVDSVENDTVPEKVTERRDIFDASSFELASALEA